MTIVFLLCAVGVAFVATHTVPKIPWLERAIIICSMTAGVYPYFDKNRLIPSMAILIGVGFVLFGLSQRNKINCSNTIAKSEVRSEHGTNG